MLLASLCTDNESDVYDSIAPYTEMFEPYQFETAFNRIRTYSLSVINQVLRQLSYKRLKMVDRDGIEPPHLGFQASTLTTELPVLIGGSCSYRLNIKSLALV
jgi:hypothetical protein